MTTRPFRNGVVGTMATFPQRFDIIRRVIASIAPQLDRLYVYVNETTEGFPDVSDLENVIVLDGRNHAGDLSANGKIYPLRFVKDCRVFTLDDDFLYPEDYVARNMACLDAFDGKCMVTTHGGILPPRVDWYYERTDVMVSRQAVASLQLCSLAGSGTMCFDQKHLKVDPDEFLDEVWVDLKLSLAAREAGLPIWVLPRQEDWLTAIKVPGLWDKFRFGGLTHHTGYAREVDWSFSIYRDIANRALENAGLTPEALGLDQELAHCLRTGETPSRWKAGYLSMSKRKDYLNLLLQAGTEPA